MFIHLSNASTYTHKELTVPKTYFFRTHVHITYLSTQEVMTSVFFVGKGNNSYTVKPHAFLAI